MTSLARRSHTYTYSRRNAAPVVSGLAAWYDTTQSAYMTLVGTAITQILDRSGNGNHTQVQSTGTARPTLTSNQINGLSCAVFDGGDTLQLPSSLLSIPNSGNTIFAVANCTDNSQQRRIIAGTDGGTSRYKLSFGTKAGSGSTTTSTFGNFTTGTVGADFTTGANTNYQVFTGTFSGTTETLSVNGQTEVSDSNAGAFTATDMYIGSQVGSLSMHVGGIAEILIYNRVLTPSEILKVNLYLANKYGIWISGAQWINSYSRWQQVLINAWQINKDDAFTNTTANPFAAIYDPSAAALGSTTSLADTGRGVNTAIEATNPPVNTASAIGTANGLLYNGTNTTLNAGSNTSVDDIFAAGGCYIGVVNPTTIGGGGSATDGARLFDKGGGSGGVRMQLIDNSGSTAAIRFVKDFSVTNGDWRTTARNVTLGGVNIIAVTYDSTSVSNDPSIYVNSLTAKGLTETLTPTLTPSSDAAASMYLGNNSSNARAQNGYVGKMVFLKSVPTTAQLTAVFNFLATESGVTLT